LPGIFLYNYRNNQVFLFSSLVCIVLKDLLSCQGVLCNFV